MLKEILFFLLFVFIFLIGLFVRAIIFSETVINTNIKYIEIPCNITSPEINCFEEVLNAKTQIQNFSKEWYGLR